MDEQHDHYKQYYELEAVGYRIGLLVCVLCGATVLIGGDGKDNAIETHNKWHEKVDK